MTVSMKAMCKRCVGMARNWASIIFCNLVHNMARAEQIIRLKLIGRTTPAPTSGKHRKPPVKPRSERLSATSKGRKLLKNRCLRSKIMIYGSPL